MYLRGCTPRLSHRMPPFRSLTWGRSKKKFFFVFFHLCSWSRRSSDWSDWPPHRPSNWPSKPRRFPRWRRSTDTFSAVSPTRWASNFPTDADATAPCSPSRRVPMESPVPSSRCPPRSTVPATRASFPTWSLTVPWPRTQRPKSFNERWKQPKIRTVCWLPRTRGATSTTPTSFSRSSLSWSRFSPLCLFVYPHRH